MWVADYFHLQGQRFLVYADRYAGWISSAKCDTGEADGGALRKHLRTFFSVHDAPQKLTTDNGQLLPSCRTKEFLTVWGVRWR